MAPLKVERLFDVLFVIATPNLGQSILACSKIKIKILNAPMNLLIDCVGRCWICGFFFLNLFPLCSHQVSRGFHEVVKFSMCSQYHHTFIAYALPKVLLFSSILGGPNRNFQTLQSFNANQNGSLQKEKLKFQGTPIQLNWIMHIPPIELHMYLLELNSYFFVVKDVYQRFKV